MASSLDERTRLDDMLGEIASSISQGDLMASRPDSR